MTEVRLSNKEQLYLCYYFLSGGLANGTGLRRLLRRQLEARIEDFSKYDKFIDSIID